MGHEWGGINADEQDHDTDIDIASNDTFQNNDIRGGKWRIQKKEHSKMNMTESKIIQFRKPNS